MTTIRASTRDRPTDDDRDTSKDAEHDTLMDTVSEPDSTSDPGGFIWTYRTLEIQSMMLI